MIHKTIKDFRFSLRQKLGTHAVTFPFLKLVPSFRRRAIGKNTDLVVEGFPRSANSYLVNLIRRRNPKLAIAHHLHVPQQIIQAARKEIPVILVIREPVGVISSLVIVDSSLSVETALKCYIHFHQKILPYREAVVVGLFERITSSAHLVLEDANLRFGLDLSAKTVDLGERGQIFDALTEHNRLLGQPKHLVATPNDEKEHRKQVVKAKIESSRLLADARDIFKKFA